ncbi:MAG: D-sedoheptulose-7-phosphate isomerase [Thermoleophilaceae bacterium]
MSGERGRRHVDALRSSLASVDDQCVRLEVWGERLAEVLMQGGRLLAAGNGGSAAQAQHLTAELVGRYLSTDRPALSAIALHADGCATSSIANDYGVEEAYARSVRAHGRPGDVLIALSTSGRSPNVLAAVEAAAEMEIETWGLTGPAPNPLADYCDEVVSVEGPTTPTIQEAHLVAVHLICAAVDARVGDAALTASDPDAGSFS